MKTVLKNKNITAGILAVLMLVSSLLITFRFNISPVFAQEVNESTPIPSYLEIEFLDNTSDEKFTGKNYGDRKVKGHDIEFIFKYIKTFYTKNGVKIDHYLHNFKKEDMRANKRHPLDDLKLITLKKYNYYNAWRLKSLEMVSITNADLVQDYYIGDISSRVETKKVAVGTSFEEAPVRTHYAPILQLNRNVEKVRVNYEGELTDETKNLVIENVKKANPNMNNIKKVHVSGNKLMIETWNRHHTGVPYLYFDVENLITRVVDKETQTDDKANTEEKETADVAVQTKAEVKVIYQYQDGSSFKEFTIHLDAKQIVDASDLEMLPDNMEFVDDFLFYEVKGDGTDKIIRIVKKSSTDSSTQTDIKETSDKETQTEEPKPEEPKTKDQQTQTELSAEDIKNLEDKANQLDERLKLVESQLIKEKEVNSEKSETIDKLQKEKVELEKQNKKLQEELKKSENKNLDTSQKAIQELEKKISALEEKVKKCCSSEEAKKPIYDSLEKMLDKLLKQVDEKIKALDKKESSSNDLKKVIELLQADKKNIKKQLDDLKQNSVKNEKSQEMKALEKSFNELNKKFNELTKQLKQKAVSSNKVNSNTNTRTASVSNKPTSNVKPTNTSTLNTTSQNNSKEQIIRYPNKLSPKAVNTSSNSGNTTNNSATADSYYGTSKPNNSVKSSNKKITRSLPSRANASVSENVNNANGEYPIHHDGENSEIYSADARQFVTFQTKNGKTFHLIINHDEETENVLLLTEVSEADLLNMVETKEEVKEPVKEVVKKEPQKEIEEVKEPVKKEEKSNVGTYLILFLVMAGVVGGGYYFKVVKAKEKKELAELEEPDDYIAKASDSDDSDIEHEAEEEANEDEEQDVIL